MLRRKLQLPLQHDPPHASRTATGVEQISRTNVLNHLSILIVVLLIGCKATSTTPPQQKPEPAPPEAVQSDSWMARNLVGKTCRVSLRRDALGMSAPGYAEPMAPMIGGHSALLSGTVEKLTSSWLVLRNESKTYWIPTSAILMIETTSK
jgi:hypothetical protein